MPKLLYSYLKNFWESGKASLKGSTFRCPNTCEGWQWSPSARLCSVTISKTIPPWLSCIKHGTWLVVVFCLSLPWY